MPYAYVHICVERTAFSVGGGQVGSLGEGLFARVGAEGLHLHQPVLLRIRYLDQHVLAVLQLGCSALKVRLREEHKRIFRFRV